MSIQGELKTYDDTGDSGQKVHRRFCPNCGSGIVAEADILPGMSLVLAGTLDDPAAFAPAMEIYCASAQPWVHAGGERAVRQDAAAALTGRWIAGPVAPSSKP